MSGFLTEIGEQPAVLRATIDALQAQIAPIVALHERLASGALRRVIFCGMGASYFATLPSQVYLVQRGIVVQSIDAAELLHYQLPLVTDDTLLVLVSQSGYSVEVVKILDALDGRGTVLGITNNAASPLATRSSAQVILRAGDELTVSSKTYTCTLAALHVVTRVLAGEAADLAPLYHIADEIEARLDGWKATASEIVARVEGSQTIVYLGRGVSLASALAGALITKESSKFPTEGVNAGQFRHGPMEMVDSRISAFVFAGDAKTLALNLGLATDIAALKGRVVTFGGDAVAGAIRVELPAVDQWLLPLVEIIPVQCFAAQFAARQGYTPGEFRYLQKVTTKE